MLRTILSSLVLLGASFAFGQAKVMNPGEAHGRLIVLSVNDVRAETPKFKSLNPLSIPVFTELPLDMSVVAGAITISQQNLLSHVQLKSRARHTPNLDISELPNGLANPLFAKVKEGDWIHMVLTEKGDVKIEKSTEKAAIDFSARKHASPIELKADLKTSTLFRSENLGWKDYVRVGSKAANYAELAKALNTPTETYVLPGFAVPFYYYEEFINSNPQIKAAMERAAQDPLMNKASKVDYRQAKLKELSDMILSPSSQVSDKLITQLLTLLDEVRTADGLSKKMRLRSSTNSEDLPNFNGAGLYDSYAYKPVQKNKEKSPAEKQEILRETLKKVWASIWNLRAYEERTYFQIPHLQVKMGIQINPSFEQEAANGVVVTKNVSKEPGLKQPGVYIESQRGNKYSVTNPDAGIKPERILVVYDPKAPQNRAAYGVHVLQKSNVADDNETILKEANPRLTMTEAEIKELTAMVLKAHDHFKPLLGEKNPDFSLDLEFKVDTEQSGKRQVFFKQARPYLD